MTDRKTKGKNQLTSYEQRCVLDVLFERTAGGVPDLRDALGMSNAEASRMWSALQRAIEKLSKCKVRTSSPKS